MMFGPNITGDIGFGAMQGMTGHGAFSTRSINGDGLRVDSSGLFKTDVVGDFNAWNSNRIFSSSDTVQPPAIRFLPCIKY